LLTLHSHGASTGSDFWQPLKMVHSVQRNFILKNLAVQESRYSEIGFQLFRKSLVSRERAMRRERHADVVQIHEVIEEPVIARNITLAPDSFNDARQIGEEFRSGSTVMINLQSLDTETKRRLVDYMSGLAHALDGKFTKVAMSVFMLAPKNVEVRDEAGMEVKNDGFFNLS
jgi:cell division inhibitor SepF